MEKLTMDVDEMSRKLGICKPKAYELVRQDGFPVIRIGKRIIIPIEAFNLWLIEASKNKSD